jgi:hypothetical protein
MKSYLQPLEHKQTLLRIFVFSLITIIIWVGFSIFLSQSNTALPPELKEISKPLNPNINMETVSRIESKRFYSPEELENFDVYYVIKDIQGKSSVGIKKAGSVNLPATNPNPTPTTAPSDTSGPNP